MTPTEVLNEINKMPLVEKRKLLDELNREITEAEETDSESREKLFLENLRRKGMLSNIPPQTSDDDIRRKFKRIEITGEPLSETIVKERG